MTDVEFLDYHVNLDIGDQSTPALVGPIDIPRKGDKKHRDVGNS